MADSVSVGERFTLAQTECQPIIGAFSHDNVWALPGYEQCDLENEMLEVLWLACRKYDPNNGLPFKPFLRALMKNRFLDLVKAANRKSRSGGYEVLSLDVEATRLVIEDELKHSSAEDIAMAHLTVRQLWWEREGKIA